jgi:polar amino acid transport system substrate-binding protein
MRFLHRRQLLLCLAAVLLVSSHRVSAQPTSQTRGTNTSNSPTVRVATRVVAPFVMRDGNKLQGFSIELWNAIAEQLGTRTEYSTNGSVKALLSAVQTRQADVGIAAISITSQRERNFDFSQPMYDSGLQIMVRSQAGSSSGATFWSVLFSPSMLQLVAIVLLMIIVPAHIVWFVERNHPDGIIENKKYFPGIFKAIWWAAGTLGAQADEMPRSNFGRFIAVIWMFIGIAFVAYFTATITTSMTVQQLHGDINGPDDLPGKRVATTTGSTSATYLRERRIQTTEYSQIDAAVDALEQGKVRAIVFDSPVLLYYAAQKARGKVEVVGPIFRKEDYGIVFPAGSRWRKPVNNALLRLKENGTYDQLHDKWFGGNETDN